MSETGWSTNRFSRTLGELVGPDEDPEFVTFMLKYGLDIRGTREQQLIPMEDA